MPTPKIDAFTRGYLLTALWTSDPDPGSGEWSEHEDWTIENIDPDSLERAIEVCKDFQEANAELLEATGADAERNGGDFWLTRNHHGAGFWDRGYPDEIGRKLTESAHAYGSADVYGPETDDSGEVSEAAAESWNGVIYIHD